MLKLKRKVGQAIVIDDDVRVIIDQVNGHTVTLAIKHPPGTAVYREEVHDQIQSEQTGTV